MKQVLISIFALGLFGAPFVGWVSQDWYAALSYGIGSGVTLINVAGTTWLWGRVFERKLLALAAFVIVFKYAILGLILFRLLKTEWMSIPWFCVGISTLVLGILGKALFGSPEASEDESKTIRSL